MVNYTFDDVLSAATKAGVLDQFSEADLKTAQIYPEFGLGMITLKQDFAKAPTEEARSLIRTAANNMRSSFANYTADESGNGFYTQGLSPSSYNRVNGQQISNLTNNIANRQPFSYNPETDPDYSSYRKQYLREGQRATADTLGQASATTGGIPSTAAVTAATQAGDYYAGQLADKVPELSQQAYGRYLNNYNLDISALGALQSQDQNMYGRMLDQVNYNSNMAVQGQEQNLAQKNEAKSTVDAILAAGGRPPAEIVAASGYPQEYINTLAAYYAAQTQPVKVSAGSGGRTGKPTLTAAQAASAAKSGITTDEVKYAYNYYYGEGSYEMAFSKTPIERFQAGDFSDEVIAGLMEMGYTQKQLADAGYAGDYFKKNLPPEAPTQSKTGNYQTVNETLAAMKASGVSNAEILTALKEVKGELSQTDYMSLYNKYRG